MANHKILNLILFIIFTTCKRLFLVLTVMMKPPYLPTSPTKTGLLKSLLKTGRKKISDKISLPSATAVNCYSVFVTNLQVE